MKKLLVVTALLLFAGIAFGQALEKGNLIGLHVLSVELKPGATMDQFIDFFNEKTKPAWESIHEGMKIFAIKRIRGESSNEFGLIIQFKDEASRNKSYNKDGSLTDFGNKTQEKMAPILTEAEKIGTWTTKYTDWLVL